MDQLLLRCGLVAGPFFLTVAFLEGTLRTGYLPWRQPVSALAHGTRGWIQRANFFITGILALAYASSLPTALRPYGGSLWAPLLIGLYGMGLIGSGIYATDITGLPKEDTELKQRTRQGRLHDVFALPVVGGLFGACIISGNLFHRAAEFAWAWYSAISGVLFVAFFVLAGAAFAGREQIARYGGLLQRIAIIVGWIWLSLSAAHLIHLV